MAIRMVLTPGKGGLSKDSLQFTGFLLNICMSGRVTRSSHMAVHGRDQVAYPQCTGAVYVRQEDTDTRPVRVNAERTMHTPAA